MKVCLWSDLHLEFHNSVPTWKNPGADILVLAGDVCVADHLYRNPVPESPDIIQKGWYAVDAARYRKFFRHVSQEFPHIVYVMGNHEHYHGRWDRTETVLRQELSKFSNIHLLEQNKIVLDDVVFLGASLWSSLNSGNPLTMMVVKDLMNDYTTITEHNNGKYHKLTPKTTLQKHIQTVEWLTHMLEEDHRPTFVVGHHAPSRQSIHDRYRNQPDMNGAYVSDLEHLMLDRDHIKYWVHGHVHDRHDYVIGQTRVVCNPHGYPNEQGQFGFDPSLILDM